MVKLVEDSPFSLIRIIKESSGQYSVTGHPISKLLAYEQLNVCLAFVLLQFTAHRTEYIYEQSSSKLCYKYFQ